jgi:hypothetical protein
MRFICQIPGGQPLKNRRRSCVIPLKRSWEIVNLELVRGAQRKLRERIFGWVSWSEALILSGAKV